jgi:two-component system cell cycle sensor histidine kinase PleC
MAPEEIPIAFAAFGQIDSRLARRYEGTGLGLPLSKAIIELHGGTITIDSAPGKGTCVTVTLPRHAANAGAAA